MVKEIDNVKSNKNTPPNALWRVLMDTIHINIVEDELNTLDVNYNLSIIAVLGDYYDSSTGEEEKTKRFYRIITSENFVSILNDIISKIKSMINTLHKVLGLKIFPKITSKEFEYDLDSCYRSAESAHNIILTMGIEKQDYEICKCGTRMTIVAELSELRCDACYRIKTILGTVFRDDQFYPQDGQKTKHGGYDTNRHYRFWIERLQALESKTFTEDIQTKIDYVITRDNYERRLLTCEQMRTIIKDPKVSGSKLNEHAPLLVKMFGGVPPPMLDFHENKRLSNKFNKAMILYDVVNPDSSNKPYYPFFIYKIIEHEFRENPEKLRLLDYIHLQSRETVIKNDKDYREMCRLAQETGVEGFVYSPTDPAGRL